MLTDCVNVMVYLEYTFVIGLSATSQEMLSTAQGAEYTLLNVIGFVLYIISQTPLVRYTFTKYGQRNVQDMWEIKYENDVNHYRGI